MREVGTQVNVLLWPNSRVGLRKACLLQEGHSGPHFLSRAPCELPSRPWRPSWALQVTVHLRPSSEAPPTLPGLWGAAGAESSLGGLQAAGAGSPQLSRSNHCPSPWLLPLTLGNLADHQRLRAGVGGMLRREGSWGLPSAGLA